MAEVSRLSNADIRRVGIDKKPNVDGCILHGDNLQFLTSLDLSKFDVVDLDAYGVPYSQLKILFERAYRGVVFVTFIRSVTGAIPHGLLVDIGFTKAMIKKVPTLFYRNGWEHFKQFLAVNGISEIYHRSHSGKHYLSFVAQ